VGGLLLMRLLNERGNASESRQLRRAEQQRAQQQRQQQQQEQEQEQCRQQQSEAAPRIITILAEIEPSTQQALGPLSLDLLSEVVRGLSCSTVLECLSTCRSWRELLDREVLWERLCRTQWPGSRPLLGGSWHAFAAVGGGDHLGKKLLWALKTVAATEANCPGGHALHRHGTPIMGFSCDCCKQQDLPVGTVMWGCRACNYDKCQVCYQMSEDMPHILAGGARNACDQEGWTALHHSCRLGFPRVAERLLEARADVETTDKVHGFTALMVGAIHGNTEVCSMLLEKGAEKGMRNNYGRCALDCAMRWGRTSLEPLLRLEGEDPFEEAEAGEGGAISAEEASAESAAAAGLLGAEAIIV